MQHLTIVTLFSYAALFFVTHISYFSKMRDIHLTYFKTRAAFNKYFLKLGMHCDLIFLINEQLL